MSNVNESMLLKKNTRTKNFDEREKKMLIELINPYKHIIENIKVCKTKQDNDISVGTSSSNIDVSICFTPIQICFRLMLLALNIKAKYGKILLSNTMISKQLVLELLNS